MNASIIIGTRGGISPDSLLFSDVDVYLIGNNMLEGNIEYLYRIVSDRLWKIGLALLMLGFEETGYITVERVDDLSRERIQRASKKYRRFYRFYFINVVGDVSIHAIKERIERIKEGHGMEPVRIGINIIAPRMPFEAQLAKAEKIEGLGFETFIYLDPIKAEKQLEFLKEHGFHRVAVDLTSLGSTLLGKLIEGMYEIVLLFPSNVIGESQVRIRSLFTIDFVTTIKDSKKVPPYYRPRIGVSNVEKIPLPIIASAYMLIRTF